MSERLINIVVWIFQFSYLSWLIVSTIIIMWWFLDNKDQSLDRYDKIPMFISLGWFAFLFIVLGFGIEEILVFIPKDWGDFNEDGDFFSIRLYIAMMLSFILSICILMVFSSLADIYKENLHLKKEIQCLKDRERTFS